MQFRVILRSLDVTRAVITDFQIKEKPRNCLFSKQLRGFYESGKRGIRTPSIGVKLSYLRDFTL
jgi:hypothetical protein